MATTNEKESWAATSSESLAMFGPHIVTLIDFLGQSGELAKGELDFIINYDIKYRMGGSGEQS